MNEQVELVDMLVGVLLLAGIVASLTVWVLAWNRWRAGEGQPVAWRPRQAVPWGLADVALVVMLYISVQFFVGLVVRPRGDLALRGLQGTALADMALLILVPALLRSSCGARREDLGLAAPRPVVEAAYGAGGLAAALLPVVIVRAVVMWLIPTDRMHPVVTLLQESPTLPNWALAVSTAVLLAPLAEELLFRGVLQGWLENRMGGWLAVVVSSLLFAGVHAPMWPDPLPLVPLALVLGYVYRRRHSLVGPFVLHASFNGLNMGLLWLGMEANS